MERNNFKTGGFIFVMELLWRVVMGRREQGATVVLTEMWHNACSLGFLKWTSCIFNNKDFLSIINYFDV